MKLTTEEDIIELIKNDGWMMDIIKTASILHLRDWCVCAGFVRSKIWDTVQGYTERTELSDIDVIFFDDRFIDESKEKELEVFLNEVHEGVPWSVKNQARMHLVNQLPPYLSSSDAISKFPETATAIGVTMDDNGNLRLIAPYGILDAVTLKLKPTPFFRSSIGLMQIYKKRLETKNWKSTWPGLTVESG
ncbi:nucleotidyltransferase family protein [Bacillus sp. JJ1609]|uniref:nucleotidyltransferase family protein n=1 Tax=Bacillus sp. JJ1609 TaxID=3122977 RepID=UPI002FFE5A24